MLNEFRQNWHNTKRKHPYTLKAETPAAGATLQRIGGGGGENTKRHTYLRFKALFLAK